MTKDNGVNFFVTYTWSPK